MQSEVTQGVTYVRNPSETISSQYGVYSKFQIAIQFDLGGAQIKFDQF